MTLSALDVALGWRDPSAGLHHFRSDYHKAQGAWHVSMSRKGDCWDNAPMESVNGTLKVACTKHQRLVEYWLLTDRRHSSLG